MKKICILGIAGFTGRYLERMIADKELYREYDFVGFDLDCSHAVKSGRLDYRSGNALEPGVLDDLLSVERPDYIVNLIGSFRAKDLRAYFEVNVGIPERICDAVIRHKISVEKILLVGSAAEYGSITSNPVDEDTEPRPVNFYGLSKVYQADLARYFFRNFGLPTVLARTFNILGEGQSKDLAIGSFMRQISEAVDGGEIIVGNLGSYRDYLEIDLVVEAYWKLLLRGLPGEAYNVCSGKPSLMRDILAALIEGSGKRLSIREDSGLFKAADIPVIYGDGGKYQRLG